MSDTVKLIIEISKVDLKRIYDGEWIGTHAYDNMIFNGTPLDSVIAKIRAEQDKHSHPLEIERAIEILDRICKESEDT